MIKNAVWAHPVWALFDGVFFGLLFAAVIIVTGSLETGPAADDLYLRAFFGFVLAVCSKPAIDGAMIELASDKSPRFGRYHYGWALGTTWGFAMILASWPLAPVQLAIWIGTAVFFGVAMAWMYKPVEIPQTRVELYQTSKNTYADWHPLWRIGPGWLLVGLFCFALLRNTGESQENPYLIFGLTAALINSNFPYPLRHRILMALQVSGITAIIAGYLSLS